MRAILNNLTTIGFMMSFLVLLISIFIDYIPFIKRLLPTEPKIIMYIAIIGCVVFSYQMGRNSYADKVKEDTAVVEAEVKVAEQKAVTQNSVIQSDILTKTSTSKEVTKNQKAQVDKTTINQECKIDNNIINTLNGAVKE